MKRYIVRRMLTIIEYHEIEIEADNEKEAKELGMHAELTELTLVQEGEVSDDEVEAVEEFKI